MENNVKMNLRDLVCDCVRLFQSAMQSDPTLGNIA
jgi:hypothetical protein